MASGIPVVASRVGGLPEVVTEGAEGYLVEPRNVEEMARKARRILENETLRLEMGERARATALTRFSTAKIIPQYESFYGRVLERA
jgi:glycosyltransferase involved in cell wall biosynthesis